MVNRSQLKFHETFQPETGYIAKIIEQSSRGYRGSKFEVSVETGIPTGNQKGKVEPHIKYAGYMGLINYSVERGIYNLSLTNLGKEIYNQDKYLHEPLSKWLCHYGITQKHTGAPQWAFLFNEEHIGFARDISSERIIEQANRFFGLNLPFEEIFGVVRRCYIDGIFSDLEMLSVDDVGKWKFEEKYERDELLYVYAYALLDGWDKSLAEKSEITLLELIDNLGFGKIFGFNDSSISEVLEMFNDEGIIILNRQLFPATLIRTSSVEEIIPQLYSRLL